MQKSFSGQIVIPSQATSAIPIINPTSDAEVTEKPITKAAILKPVLKGNLNSKRLCRNVIIHGFCKYEGKGCEFSHNSNSSSAQTSPENKNKARAIPVFSVTAESINAPEFVPRFNTDANVISSPTNKDTPLLKSPKHTFQSEISSVTNGFSQFGISNEMNGNSLPLLQQQSSPPPSQMSGMESYYYMDQQPVYPRQPLQHHFYSQPAPKTTKLLPHQRVIQNFFISDEFREQLTQRNEAQLMTAAGLPTEVHTFQSLYPLELSADIKSPPLYGHSSTVYKAVSSLDGLSYALVRIDGYRLVNEMALQVVDAWRRIRHCNIVTLRESFTTRAFGDTSLVFVYDYHPCSTTLYSTYFINQGQHTLGNIRSIPEATIWSYIIQIVSALKAIHGSGLAARCLDPKKILITGKNRIRLNGCGIIDVLQYDGIMNVARQQQEDLLEFGKLILKLACYSTSFSNLQQSFEHITKCYSPDLKNFIFYLWGKGIPTKSIDEVIVMIGPRILSEINSNHFYNDSLENELSRELENGRLVKLMSKMGFINERPEFDMDPSWSETGDRYLIKLFRDYVFHQVDENGKPVIDISHVLTCLSKLEVGLDEKIMLMSRDEQSCLIVSYKEIKNCIISAYNDLTSGRK